jgi:gluconate 5-dehydrogenase
MIAKKAGKIINICSLMSELGRETVGRLCFSQRWFENADQKPGFRMGEYNIQVNGLGPGYIATPQTAPLRTPGHPFNEFIIAKLPQPVGNT